MWPTGLSSLSMSNFFFLTRDNPRTGRTPVFGPSACQRFISSSRPRPPVILNWFSIESERPEALIRYNLQSSVPRWTAATIFPLPLFRSTPITYFREQRVIPFQLMIPGVIVWGVRNARGGTRAVVEDLTTATGKGDTDLLCFVFKC